MCTPPSHNHYKNHRFPAEIISHAVWLYFRFCLSYRDGEELLFARGITVTYEAIRKWCRKFGQSYANELRHRRPRGTVACEGWEVCPLIGEPECIRQSFTWDTQMVGHPARVNIRPPWTQRVVTGQV